MIAGIELGGTKTVVGVGGRDGELAAQHRFPTTGPKETIDQAARWIQEQGAVSAIGVGSFGPIGINEERSDYGKFLETPKTAWAHFDLLHHLRSHFPKETIRLDTDANSAAFMEASVRDGEAQRNLAYITIGTGIGGGIICDGRIVHGALHSEFGHLRVPRHPDDGFAGVCPYHQDCLEGLASGPAIEARWGQSAHALPPTHQAWDLEAFYLAHGILALLATVCPTQVVVGGGVSQSENLHHKIEAHLRTIAGGYFASLEEFRPFVQPPHFAQDAGIRGALLLTKSR